MSQTIDKIHSCYPLFEQDEYQTLFQNKKTLEEAHDAQRVQEVFAWTTTAEYEALNFQREALTVDPAKACQPLGAVLCALGFAGTEGLPVARAALLAALRDADWQVREEAAATLGKLLDPAGGEGLIDALSRDTYWEVRLKAANALGRLKAPAAVPALLAALEHAVSNLRKEAANALEAIGDRSALPRLRRAAAEDPDLEVRKTAQRIVGAWQVGR